MKKKKYYVVWVGRDTGVYDSWEEARELVDGFQGAKFKSYNDRDSAIAAFRGEEEADTVDLLSAIATGATAGINLDALPQVDKNGIAVDAACSGNPGNMEYRGVELSSGREIFHQGPFVRGTNNIGEFLAIVHALALLEKQGRTGVTVYSDSVTALSWIRRRTAMTKMERTPQTEKLFNLLSRAETWLRTHNPSNHVTKWNTQEWGEIPADFGRK